MQVERGDLLAAYYRRLTGDDKEVQLACTKAWITWETSISRLKADPSTVITEEDAKLRIQKAKIEW